MRDVKHILSSNVFTQLFLYGQRLQRKCVLPLVLYLRQLLPKTAKKNLLGHAHILAQGNNTIRETHIQDNNIGDITISDSSHTKMSAAQIVDIKATQQQVLVGAQQISISYEYFIFKTNRFSVSIRFCLSKITSKLHSYPYH